eukprot:5120252-Amphidinium_carterae.1
MLLEITTLDASFRARVPPLAARRWICRVPIQSNPADAHSRMQCGTLPGGQRVAIDEPVWPEFLASGSRYT